MLTMTRLVLTITGFVFNMTGFVPNLTGLVLLAYLCPGVHSLPGFGVSISILSLCQTVCVSPPVRDGEGFPRWYLPPYVRQKLPHPSPLPSQEGRLERQ